MFDLAVIKAVAFAQEIDAILSIGNDCDHSVGAAHNPVNPQTADQQAGLTRRKVLWCRPAATRLPAQQWRKGIAPHDVFPLGHRLYDSGGYPVWSISFSCGYRFGVGGLFVFARR